MFMAQRSQNVRASLDALPVLRNVRIGRFPREYELATFTRWQPDGEASATVSVLGRSQSGKTVYARELRLRPAHKEGAYFAAGVLWEIPRAMITGYTSFIRA